MDPTALAVQAVGGFTVGLLVGLAVRKLSYWLLLALGFMLVPVYLLWQLGVLQVDWAAVSELVGRLAQWLSERLADVAEAAPSMGVAGAAAAVGLVFGLTGLGRHSALGGRRFVRRVG